MSFACDRGLFGSALEGVGVLGCRSLGCGRHAVRLPRSRLGGSPSFQYAHSPSQVLPVFHQGIGSERCGGGASLERSNRTYSSLSRLLQLPVRYPQGHRELAACNRPLPSQPVCSSLSFSHGDSTVGPPVSASWGLDGVSGPKGRIPSGSCSSGVSLLTDILWRGGLLVLRSLLRPFDSSAGVHSRLGPDFVDYASSRVPDPEVPRRLACPRVLVPGSGSGEGLSPLALPGARCPGQPGEELSDSHSDLGLPGDAASDASFGGFSRPPKRVLKLASLFSKFTSCHLQPLPLWRQLLGVMLSLSSIVPGSLLRMRSLQLRLNSAGCLLTDSDSISWDSSSRRSSAGSLSSQPFAVHRRLGFWLGCPARGLPIVPVFR